MQTAPRAYRKQEKNPTQITWSRWSSSHSQESAPKSDTPIVGRLSMRRRLAVETTNKPKTQPGSDRTHRAPKPEKATNVTHTTQCSIYLVLSKVPVMGARLRC